MSLSELTRNAFQSGLSATKWLSLCKLLISKNLAHGPRSDIESDLSSKDEEDYHGDPSLREYLRLAILDGVLSLSAFISTFLSRLVELERPSTLDMLCRLALDCHYSSGMASIASMSAFGQSLPDLLNNIQNVLSLLRIAYTSTSNQFHPLTNSASELLILLLSIISDVSQIPTAQAMGFIGYASELLQHYRLSPEVRHVLENFMLSLSLVVGDEKAARQAQVMHTLQLALGKGDIAGGNSTSTDIIMCGLLLHALVSRRASDFGSGDGRRAVVLFIALARWTSWAPSTFYTQLLRSAVTCFAQAATVPLSRNATLWRAFVIGRLPLLLSMFEKAADLDSASEADWRPAMHMAVASLLHYPDLLAKCDSVYQLNSAENNHPNAQLGPFMIELVHQLLATGLVEQTVAASMYPTMNNEFHPRIQMEAQEHGSDLETYLDSRLGLDTNAGDASDIVEKIWKDPCSHPTFAEIVQKRFKSYHSSNDIESLGHLCSILYEHEHAIDILSLHVNMQDLLAHALAIVEDYDCETVGDPQAAVTHFGNIVLFLQMTLTKFNLGGSKFSIGDRILTNDILDSAAVIRRIDELKGDDASAFSSWLKTLFDSSSEAATLLSHSIIQCLERKLEKEVLNMGVSYFQGPLLNWTLVGVIVTLLRDIQRRGFMAPVTIHIEVLHTLLQSPSCPAPVLRLSGPLLLRVLPTTKIQPAPQSVARGVLPFDPQPLRKLASQSLGLTTEGSNTTLSLQSTQSDPVAHAIRESLASARAGKAPALDVDWCLLFTNPTKFLTSLWAELSLVSTMGDLEAPRRLATFVLSTPRSPRTPPLLPVFLHMILPNIISTADQLAPAEQTLAVELIVGVISGALTAALFVDAALLSVEKQKEQRLVFGQPALTMARRLSGDLKRRANSPTSSMVMQRLTSSASFMANFPTFMTEL